MSYTFSRRAFLKYSAATAVAVAGASLLGGCEYQDPKNPVCKTLPGAIKSDLQVIAGLKSMKIESNSNTCRLEVDIESARANPIRLTTDCFSIAVKDSEGKSRYFSMNYGGVQILNARISESSRRNPSRSIWQLPTSPSCRMATPCCSSTFPSATILSIP